MEMIPLIADVLANVKKKEKAILVDMCGKTLYLGDTLGNGKTIKFKMCAAAETVKHGAWFTFPLEE